MKAISRMSVLGAALLALAGCDLRYALGFPPPVVKVTGPLPLELAYREAQGGLVILRGRVNGKADIDFILDTGAPVSVLIEGAARKSCYVNGVREEREGPPAVVTLGAALFEVAAPIYSASANAVDGGATSTIGIGLFKDRRFAIDYPGKRLVLLAQ